MKKGPDYLLLNAPLPLQVSIHDQNRKSTEFCIANDMKNIRMIMLKSCGRCPEYFRTAGEKM